MLPVVDVGEFNDGSFSFSWEIRDDETVGSTFFDMSEKDHPSTLCIATQLGCSVGCRFCRAHLRGGVSNLTPGEMLAQVNSTIDYLRTKVGRTEMDALQIAFMGYGEPMHNLDNVIEARRAADDCVDDLQVSFTLSTSGWVPGIQVLTQREPSFRLYVSLHASDDQTREQLIPATQTFPIEDIVSAAESYARASEKRVTANYLLIDNINDGRQDAQRLADLLDPELFVVSLSHLVDPPDERLQQAEEAEFEAFREWLVDAGIDTRVF